LKPYQDVRPPAATIHGLAGLVLEAPWLGAATTQEDSTCLPALFPLSCWAAGSWASRSGGPSGRSWWSPARSSGSSAARVERLAAAAHYWRRRGL